LIDSRSGLRKIPDSLNALREVVVTVIINSA
jgi:hypothetical protein